MLRGIARGPVCLALPALESMLDGSGRAWADGAPLESRFVFWFNGNGYPEKYLTPDASGPGLAFTPCLAPLASLRRHIHLVTGLDNVAANGGPGNGHTNSMSGLVSGTRYTGRGAGGISIDQAVAAKIGGDTRFRSLQVGVAHESFGESMQRNMSWSGADRPLPPELLPTRLFDRLFGQRELGWARRQRSILDAVRADAADLAQGLGAADRRRLDEHLASVRALERSIAELPSEYKIDAPETDGDPRDWPRIARLQSDLLAHAFASRQTRVASYMLTKCQSLTRFPWLGHTVLRHHDYTHERVEPGTQVKALRAMLNICRWHVEELAYFLAKLKSVPEGDGTVLDHTCALFMFEHAEASHHKNTGHSVILAGGAGGLVPDAHTLVSGTFGDLFLTVAQDALGAAVESFPTGRAKLSGIFARPAGV